MIEFSYLEIIAILLLSYFCLKIVINLLKTIWTNCLAYKLGFGVKWRTGDNVWAVVTGATDGIGLEYAKQLSKIGYNLVIISRSEDKLKATQKDLQQNFKNEVRIISADLSRTDIYESIGEELNKLGIIHVLVNNAGGGYTIPEYFLRIPIDFEEKAFNLNMLAPTKLIHLVLPQMVKRRSGVIINISSTLGEFPMPLVSSYCSYKAYLTLLSEALSVEYESYGVIIQTVAPGQVKTKLTKDIEEFMSVTPQQYVRSALTTVGIEPLTYGHWKHKLMMFFMSFAKKCLGIRRLMKAMFLRANKNRIDYYNKNKIDSIDL